MIDLVAGLSRRGMKSAADAVVAEAVTRLRGEDAADFADALREAGRDADAAQLYAAAIPAIGCRAPEQLAGIAAELVRQKLTDAAAELVNRAAAESGTVPARARLLRALATHPMLADRRSALVARFGAGLDQASLRELADELRTDDGDPVEIYIAAAAAQPVEVVIGFLDDVLDQGLLREALRLIDWAAAERSVEDLAALSRWFTEPYRIGLLQQLVAGIKNTGKMLLFALHMTATDGHMTGAMEREIAARAPGELTLLVARLLDRCSADIASRLVLERVTDPRALTETDRVALLAAFAAVPGLDGLLINLAVEQLRAGPASGWPRGSRRSSGESSGWPLAALRSDAISAVVNAVDADSLWSYLVSRSAREIVVVLDIVRATAEPVKFEDLTNHLVNAHVDLVSAVLLEAHRAGHEELGLRLAARYRETASETTADEVGARLRIAGVESTAQRLLEGRLWLPPAKVGDVVARAVAGFLHDVRLSGRAWRYPVDPAVLRELTTARQLGPSDTCLLVWQWAGPREKGRILFTTDMVRPWHGTPVRYADLAGAETRGHDLRVDSAHGPVVWMLNSAFLAPDLRDVVLRIRDIVRGLHR